MAVTLVTVTGNLETLTGAAPSLGRIWFRLNRPDWNLSGDIFAPEYIEAIADAGGAFSKALQSTDYFETGATYSAILKYREPLDGKDREYTLGTFALPAGGPWQLGDLLAVPIIAPVPSDILALCQAYALAAEADRIAAQAAATAAGLSEDAAAVSAAQAALYDGPWLDDVADIVADVVLTYTPALPGTVVAGDTVQTRKDQFSGTVLASGTPVVSPYIQTAGSVVLRMLPDGRGVYSTASFGTGNLSDQFARALDAVRDDMTVAANAWLNDTAGIVIPRGVYNLSAPLVVSDVDGFVLYGRGAVLTSTAAFTPFKIVESRLAHIFGLAIDLRNNNLADQAFHVAGMNDRLIVDDLIVQSNSSNASFAAVRMQQGNASALDDADRNKGNFWNTFNNFWHRKLQGGDPNVSAMGFDVQGAQNALTINNGVFNTIGTGVLVRNQNSSLTSGLLNDIQMNHCKFESFTTGFKFQMDGGATGGWAGGAAFGCRFEAGTTAFESASANQPSTPLMITGTTRISSVTNLTVDARTFKDTFNIIGGSITPNNEQRFTAQNRVIFGNLAGATGDPCVEVLPRAASSGGSIMLRRSDGTTVDGKISQRSGGGMEIDGGTLGIVIAKNVKGLSSTAVHAQNMVGTATVVAATTSIAVTFGTAEADASYRVMIEPNYNTTAWVSGKGTGGFTINVGTAPGANTAVAWFLVR